MKRIVPAFILAVMMVFALAGCGSSDSNAAVTPTTEPTATPTPEPIPTPEPLSLDEFVQAVKEAIDGEVGDGESILDVKLDGNNLTVYVDLNGAGDELAETRFSSITDEILEIENCDDLWETITVDFGDLGFITCGKDDVVDSEYGRYFDGFKMQKQAQENTVSNRDEQSVISGTAEYYLTALKNAGCDITEIYAWTEETDLNGLLGRPGNYISKADFMDSKIDPINKLEPVEEYGLPGGTLEVFANESDCNARYAYLDSMDDPSLGAFGLNQYMYKNGVVLLRVSYDLTPSQAEVYETAFQGLFE